MLSVLLGLSLIPSVALGFSPNPAAVFTGQHATGWDVLYAALPIFNLIAVGVLGMRSQRGRRRLEQVEKKADENEGK